MKSKREKRMAMLDTAITVAVHAMTAGPALALLVITVLLLVKLAG